MQAGFIPAVSSATFQSPPDVASLGGGPAGEACLPRALSCEFDDVGSEQTGRAVACGGAVGRDLRADQALSDGSRLAGQEAILAERPGGCRSECPAGGGPCPGRGERGRQIDACESAELADRT